jgi:hypothetical protein
LKPLLFVRFRISIRHPVDGGRFVLINYVPISNVREGPHLDQPSTTSLQRGNGAVQSLWLRQRKVVVKSG